MFERWKLKRRLAEVGRTTARLQKQLDARKADRSEYQHLEWDEHEAIKDIEHGFDYVEGTRLLRLARDLDIELPPHEDDAMWFNDTGESGFMWFTSKGRAHVRKLIDTEKARRFEVKTLWVTKIILPLAGVIVGIIGALTGLIAVSRHPTREPDKKTPIHEQLLRGKAMTADLEPDAQK